MSSTGRRVTRTARRAIAAAMLFGGLAGPALAQGTSVGAAVIPAPSLSIGPGEQAVARRVDLAIGRSLVVDLPRDAKEVFVANPKIANAVVRSTRKLFVIGMENGATSILVMDAEGRQFAALDVTVGRDLNVLREMIRTAMPGSHVVIKPAGDSIVLTGTVASATEAQQATDIANSFVGTTSYGASSGQASGGQGGTNISVGAAGSTVTGRVINALTIKGKDQVMLRVTVVEVARNVLKQFGISSNASWSTNPAGNFFNNANGFPVNQGLERPNALKATAAFGGFQASATLQAFERAGVSRILAEPTLTAISGESAKFTVGGEIPIPIPCTGIGCTPTVDFKPFGVLLNFTPVVMSENRISLRVGTEVSEIDTTISAGGYPGFRLRRSETTVELPSGGVMMTAGLIQQTSRQSIEGLPGLLNVPVLGTLFRSRDYQRQETELMIMVSPYIAKPMEPAQVRRPDDGFVDSSDSQAILLGRLNRLYGVAGAPPLKPAKGLFGFITD